MKSGMDLAEDLLAQLRPGFFVLADMTALETMDLDCVPLLTRMMDRFKVLGVDLVIRVLPDPHKDIGLISCR